MTMRMQPKINHCIIAYIGFVDEDDEAVGNKQNRNVLAQEQIVLQ